MRKIRLFSLIIFTVLLFTRCEEFDQKLEQVSYDSGYYEEEEYEKSDRTLVMYLAMNNNLAGDGKNNINEILSVATPVTLSGARIVIYAAFPAQTPLLLEVKTDKKKAYLDTLVKYPAQNSVHTDVFRQALDDAKTFAPAGSYGLIVGSHASGWLAPSGVSQQGLLKATANKDITWALPRPENSITRVIMQETSASDGMILKDFAAEIHEHEFEYIMFDACMMGGVETAYELRDKTDWIIASPAEVISTGFPYTQIVADLMAPTARLEEVCRKFYEYYAAKSGDWQTATIGLYDCSKMDALADVMKTVATQYSTQIAAMNISTVQHFDRTTLVPQSAMFDVVDFIEKIEDVDPLLVEQVKTAVEDVVVYARTTPWILNSS
ncbi:MAG: hypothetical protein LBU95_05230, partial [Rikenellaceae bacterium]|nr:hypothetical protein [Rikenellaceae bacterium]